METIKFSQNWNNKLLLDNYFTTIRVYSKKKHIAGCLIKCEYTRRGETIEFITEIATVQLVKLDLIPEFVFMTDTGYPKQESISMFEKMYQNTAVNVHEAQFAIICLKHRPDLEEHVKLQHAG